MSAQIWTDADKRNLTTHAKRIYADSVLKGRPLSKTRCYQEAVSLLPPEKQHPIPSLAHIAYWVNKPDHWPAHTEPVDVVEALRQEQNTENTRIRISWDSPDLQDKTKTDDAVTASEASEPANEPPVESTLFVEQIPLSDVAADVWEKEEAKSETTAHAAVATEAPPTPAEVPVVHKHRDMSEAPEALFGRAIMGMVKERCDAVIDKRIEAVLVAKVQAQIETAIQSKLIEFESKMLDIVAMLDSSVNQAVTRILDHISLPSTDTNTNESSTEESPSEVPIQADAAQPSKEDNTYKPTILVVGVHHRIRDAVMREFQRSVNLEVWVGPEDKRSVETLMRMSGLEGVLIGPTNGGLDIYAALKKFPDLPQRKISGSYSSIKGALDNIIQAGKFIPL